MRRVAAGVTVGEEGAVAAQGDAAQQNGEGGAQPDGGGALADGCAGGRIHEGAAAGGQDDWGAFQEAAHDAALAGAEIGLTELAEQFGNGTAGGGLDLRVGVAEGEVEAGGEAAADCGFAGAHQTDEDNAVGIAAGWRPF